MKLDFETKIDMALYFLQSKNKILLEERDENALQEYQEDQRKAKDQIHMLDCISVYPITISPDKK